MAWLDFAVLALIYIFVLFKKWGKSGKRVLIGKTFMYVYLSFVLYFTLMPIVSELPFVFNHEYRPMNLHPFEDIILHHANAKKEVILNVVMTIPFGMLFPVVHNNKKFIFIKTVFATFFLSLFIELVQPLINGFRASDITDVITNTVGGIIGFLIYYCIKYLIVKLNKKN